VDSSITAHIVLFLALYSSADPHATCRPKCRKRINYKSASKQTFPYIDEHMDIKHYLEPEQINTILEHAKTCSSRDYIILRLLWRSGMRVSELLALTPSDLEPYNQVLNITKAKVKKQRHVVVDPPMFAMLSTYISETEIPEEQPIFGFSSVHIWRLCQKYGKMIGVDAHPHMLRHSYAIHLIQNGVDLRRLQQLLGHSNSTRCIYLQFNDQDLREGYNKIEF